MRAERNGDVSFWYADIGGLPAPRPPLPGDLEADVAIIGAGYTGLWTAYYLKKTQPDLRIVILEREFAGFGASGRNGGWLSGAFGWSREKYLKTSTRAGVIAMQEAMAGTVDEVIRVAEAEGIDADIRRVDNLTVWRAHRNSPRWPTASPAIDRNSGSRRLPAPLNYALDLQNDAAGAAPAARDCSRPARA